MSKNTDECLVQIDTGKIVGCIEKDVEGNNYYSFKGIPYAQPPLGPKRFKPPQPVEPWVGKRSATAEGHGCYGRHIITKKLTGSEDCLYLNVHTKHLDSKKYQPVMVYLHGGRFVSGSGSEDLLGPQFLLTQRVVLVTFNYRTGILGFIKLDDPSLEVPGNCAIRDQIMALKWVQNNITIFGGDPDNVTLFAESAGAVCAHHLLLSEAAQDLFHKVILQSGAANLVWAADRNATAVLAQNVNIQKENESELLQYLRSLPVEELHMLQEKFGLEHLLGPCVEKLGNNQSVVTGTARKLIAAGNYRSVPMIFGYNSGEGMYINILRRTAENTLEFAYDIEAVVAYCLKLNRESESCISITNKVKAFYFDQQEPSLDNLEQIYNFLTDIFFLHGIIEAIRQHAVMSIEPIYFYRFDVESSLNFYKNPKITLPGACHADELCYLFKTAMTPDTIPENSIEKRTIKRMITLWTNFARYGDPNPTETSPDLIDVVWERVLDKNRISYIDIGSELRVDVNPAAKRIAFWDMIYNSLRANDDH